MGVDDRLQTMKGVGVLHPVEVEVPAQHIIIHSLCFFFFCFSFHTFSLLPPPLFYILSMDVWPPPSLPPSLSAFVLPVTRLFLQSSCVGLVICWNLEVSSIFSSCTILLLSVPTPFYQHLPFPHSANLSPWHLSNSPCSHSVVPLIACSFTLPLSFSPPFLALSALAVWQLLEHTLLSSYHQLAEVCVSVCVHVHM